MTALPTLSVAERVFGLSRIWNPPTTIFAFFGRVPDLDWDAAYQEYLPQVMAAEGWKNTMRRCSASWRSFRTAIRWYCRRKRSISGKIGPSWP
jgi:hypothetical protein